MFRTIGFIPVIAGLVDRMGNLHPAYIYGYLWLNRSSDSQFSEPLENLPARLGISRTTIKKWLKWLCEEDYLVDLTPELINEAHTYQLTNKVEVEASVQIAIWPNKSNGQLPVEIRPVNPANYRSYLDRHDHDMMHDHDHAKTDQQINEIERLWVDLGFDRRALPKMLKSWAGNLSGLAFCLDHWLEACAGNFVPESWGAGLIYKKISEGQLPPEKPKTFGDEVRELMDALNGAGDEPE